MDNISKETYNKLKQFLEHVSDIEKIDYRKQVAQDAGFPEDLMLRIKWELSPVTAFVSHFLEKVLDWGTYDTEDSRIAIAEYLKLLKPAGGGEHRQYIDILLQKIHEETHNKNLIATAPPEVTFINREKEILILIDSTIPVTRYAINAPADYGKSWLLDRLRETIGSRWHIGHVKVFPETTILQVTNGLLDSLGISNLIANKDEISALAREFAQLLKKEWGLRSNSPLPPSGICIFIDFEGSPKNISVIEDLLGSWLDLLTEELYSLKRFELERTLFRVFIGGRFFGDIRPHKDFQSWLRSKHFKLYILAPFDDQVVEQAVGKYLKDISNERQGEIWTTSFFLTGGHPGCLSKILKLYWQESKPSPKYFFETKKDEINEIVSNELDQVLSDLPLETKDILLQLSVFRSLDLDILEDILKNPKIAIRWDPEDPMGLANYLTRTYLVAWDNDSALLKDGITRRIILLSLRANRNIDYKAMFLNAISVYSERIESKSESNLARFWVMEFIYATLQSESLDLESDLNYRQQFRDSFWGTDDENTPPPEGSKLHSVLSLYTKNRDPKKYKNLEHFLRLLFGDDWELRFLVNYLLRNQEYDQKWYMIFESKVRAYFNGLVPM